MGFNEDLEKRIKELTESARQVGYNEGLNDAWECARQITLSPEKGGLSVDILREIFETDLPYKIIMSYTVQEATRIIQDYQKRLKNTVNVGDEILNNGSVGYVTMIKSSSNESYVLWSDGRSGLYSGDFILRCRTGRNYSQMADFINQIKEFEGDK